MFFLFCKIMVLFSCISAVCNKESFFLLYFLSSQAVFQKLAVAVVVLLVLIIRDDRAVFAHRLFQIWSIFLIFFPGFPLEGCIWVRWILEHAGMETTIFFCAQAADSFFYNGLFRKAADLRPQGCSLTGYLFLNYYCSKRFC